MNLVSNEIIAQVRNKNLFFSDKIDESIQNSEMIFMAVNKPKFLR